MTQLICVLACTLMACAGPRSAMSLAPSGHGQMSTRPTPRAVAWRANALAAPCALHCQDSRRGQGLACICHSLDTIYYTHLEQVAHGREASLSAQ